MSDPQYGEPVDENIPTTAPTSADDAVASAHEGLADAEAASREVLAEAPAESFEHPADAAGEIAAEPVTTPVAAEPDAETVVVDAAPTAAVSSAGYYDAEPVDESYTPGAYSSDFDAPTEIVAPVAVVAPAVIAPAAPQPIFVQAPEAPRLRGNRGAAALIGVLAALSFGILYLAAAMGLRAVGGDVTTTNIGDESLRALTSWWFWVPVVVFFLAFWLLGAIINRGRWGHWVIFGLLVGAASYGGHILGQLFQAPFWSLTASQGQELVRGQVLAPLAIVAFVVGRELTIWFGAWVAARGKRISELNRESQREYERTLEAGPRLHQG